MSEHMAIRLGIIGAGGIFHSRHFPGLGEIEDVKLVAVCNRSEASSHKVAKAYDIAHVESDWRKLIARDDLDAVMIGTWPYMHKQMSVAALEAGKHVFCQARMASDLAEAREMAAAAERYPQLVNMLCPPPHRMPWEPYIQHLLVSGELGDLREVRLRCINDVNLGESLTWREQVEYSGKQVMQVGIWAETLNAWVGEYDTLCATTATPIATKHDSRGNLHQIRIPQIVMIHGTLASGAAIGEHHSGVALHEHENRLTLYGTRGTLAIDAMQSIRFGAVGEKLALVDVPAQMLRPWRVERDFIEAVRAARRGEAWQVSPDFAEGLAYMKKVEALCRSAQTGQAVKLAEL